MRIEHVALNVGDPAGMAKWYVENLEFRIVRSSDGAPYAHFLADGNGVVLELFNNTEAAFPDYASLDPNSLHIAFLVDDMEAVRGKLLAAGATPEGGVLTTEAGDQLAFLRDPWKVTVQLVKRQKSLV